jgi:hypothetical protein
MNKKITFLMIVYVCTISFTYSSANRFFYENDIFTIVKKALENKLNNAPDYFYVAKSTSNLSIDSYTVAAGSTTLFNVKSNDAFIAGEIGFAADPYPTQTASNSQYLVLNNLPLTGNITLVDDNGTLKIQYVAPSNISGTDTFSYTITDASGDASTATVTVTVTVGAAAPLEGAVDDNLSVLENSIDNLINVLANDNFGIGVGTLLINSVDHLIGTTAQGGTLTLDDGGTSGIIKQMIEYYTLHQLILLV